MKKITKGVALLLVAVLLLFGLVACSSGKKAPAKTTAATTITITDHDGNVVAVPKTINRIVVCDLYPLPSVLSVFFDSAKKIVGMAAPSMKAAKNSLLSELYPDILNAETGFINGTTVNTEELMKLKPDVVFYGGGNTALGKQLRDAGFAAVAISASKWDYNAIATLNHWIELLSEIFPENNRAATVQRYSDDTYSFVQQRVAGLNAEKRAKVFFLFQYSDSALTTSGKHFFGQWWADAIGADNAAVELVNDNSAAVNMEQVYQWNPQQIFITNFTTAQPEDLYQNRIGTYKWDAVSAVQNKKVYKMPLGMYRSYTAGADTPLTLLWLAKTTYPDLFEDIDITAKTKEYYKTVFDITLTDAQAQKIFTPVSDASAF